MKKTAISIIASTAIAGALFVGCGSSSSGGTAVQVPVQASEIDNILVGGMTISFTNENNISLSCSNEENLTGYPSKLTTTNMEGTNSECTILNEEFEVEVNTAKAYAGDVQISDKLGTAPLKGFKGKKVNVFSTLAKLQGKKASEFTDIDANNEKVQGLKDLIQLAIATSNGLDATSANKFDLAEILKLANGDDDVNTTIFDAMIVEIESKAGNIDLSSFKGSAGLTNIQKIRVKDTNGTISFESDDENVSVDDINTALETAKNAPKLSLASVSMTIGSSTYKASQNDFALTATVPTVDANDTLSFDINFDAINNPSDDAATLTLEVENTATNNTVELEITNVKIMNKSITLSENLSQVTLTSTAEGMKTAMGSSEGTLIKTIGTSITNTDGKFDLLTVLSNLGDTSSTVVTNIKAALLDYLAAGGTFDVKVNVTGLGTDIKTNIPTDGFTGTITLSEDSDDTVVDSGSDNEDNNTSTGEDNNETETPVAEGTAIYTDQAAGGNGITGFSQSILGLGDFANATVTMTTEGTVPANEPAGTSKTIFYFDIAGKDNNSNYIEVGVDESGYTSGDVLHYYVTLDGTEYEASVTVGSITAEDTITLQ